MDIKKMPDPESVDTWIEEDYFFIRWCDERIFRFPLDAMEPLANAILFQLAVSGKLSGK